MPSSVVDAGNLLGPPPPHVCGRCRRSFPAVDAVEAPMAQVDWWACPACRAVLFGEPQPAGDPHIPAVDGPAAGSPLGAAPHASDGPRMPGVRR